MSDFAKFVAVSGFGLLLDIMLALFLSEFLAFPLWIAATISYFTIAVLNYLAFQFWVFSDNGRDLSILRLLLTVMASCAAVAVRIGTLLALTPLISVMGWPDVFQSATLLVVSAACSVMVNFLINRYFVFRTKQVEY